MVAKVFLSACTSSLLCKYSPELLTTSPLPIVTISLKKLINLLLLAYCALVIILFLQYEILGERSNGLVSFQGVLLTIESVLVCAFLISRSSRRELGLIMVLLLMVGMYYWLPIINLILFPENFMRGYPLTYHVPREDVDTTLTFLAVAIPLSVLALMRIGDRNNGDPVNVFRSAAVAMRVYAGTFALLLVSSVIELYRYLVIGQGRFGDESTAGGNWIFYLITDIQLICIIYLAAGVSVWPHLHKKGRLLYMVGLVAYTFTRMVTGSKGGVFDVAIYSICIILIFSDLDRIKIKLLIVLTLSAAVLFPISFMAGFVTRAVTFSSELRSQSINVNDIYDQGFISFGEKEEIFSPINVIKRMATRVNALDVLVLIVRKGTEVKQDFWDTIPKAIVNLIMPGDPFGDILSSSRLFLVEYGSQSMEEASIIYHTDIWYLYGIFIPFVGIIGSLILLFISLNIFSMLYHYTFRLHDRYRFYYLIFLFYSFYWFIVNLGIDEWVAIIVKAGVNLVFFIFAIYWLGQWITNWVVRVSVVKKDFSKLINKV